MGLFSSLRDLCFGPSENNIPIVNEPGNSRSERTTTRVARSRKRRCHLEQLESRRLMAGDTIPEVLLASVYFEEASQNDGAPDVIEVSFVGGAPGTTLDRLVINGDKTLNGFSEGDIIFDTAAGGLGAFGAAPLSIVSHNGFTVNSATVVDGGSQIVFTFSGFQAGMKLRFSVDVDEVQFIETGAIVDGVIVDQSKIEINSVTEGAEFQRTIMTGNFSAPGYVDLTLEGLYWDFYDERFATAESATGLTAGLPKDRYVNDGDLSVWTDGAIAHKPQIPLATLAGWVYHDRDDDGVFDRSGSNIEQGIGGVTLELLDANGNGLGIFTTTSTNPAILGFYEFKNLFPGTYGVREVHPDGWLDGKDTAGSHGGTAASEAAGRVDKIFGAVLNFGDHAVEYNFGELLPGSIRGRVHADHHEDCDFDEPEILLEGVRIDLLDAQGNLIRFTLTDENGEYEFTGLTPGIYSVREHQPAGYYDGGERIGSLGGSKHDVAEIYSIFTGIHVGSDQHGIQYDFCEKVGVTLSGNVYHDRDDDGNFDRPGEEGIGQVVVMLLDANGNDTAKRATTNSAGYYEFTNLRAGTYSVRELHPDGWLDGKDTPGNLGGTADVSPPGDKISQITINWGQTGVEYNFGELLPGSIRGRVHADDGPDCNFDDPHHMLEGVQIDLLDAQGNVIATTYTNADGEYAFTGLRPGTYSVREHDPVDYFDGGERVGTLGGNKHDVPEVYSFFTDIHVGSDQHGIQYDFCEKPPASISGRVHADTHEDCDFDHPDILLEGVVIELRDAQGNLIATTTTNALGEYKFEGLRAGEYTVHEIQPTGYYDGGERVGTAGGQRDFIDSIFDIHLEAGMHATQYDFCEKLPASIAGRVHADHHEDCDYDDPEILLEGVVIELRDMQGNLIATTTTNALGEYKFENLRPGDYQVHEIQPTGYYDGGERVGTAGGTRDGIDTIHSIHLHSGLNAIQYDFCEKIGVTLSGNVYHDRDDDGNFDRPGEEGIAGVVLMLLDAAGNDTGKRATTNSVGHYEFTNLAKGTYSVVELHPAGWLDGKDTPGNLGGTADVSPPGDKISQITINWGEEGIEYNFGELLPGSIRGRVHADDDPECNFDDPHVFLEGVQIDLLDAQGNVIATTFTNTDGEYAFTGLRPGTYSVREHDPVEYFDGGERVGTLGGNKHDVPEAYSFFTDIHVGSDQHGIQYDFCEKPGGEISGYVFIDGAPILIEEGQVLTPAQIAALRNGIRTADDTPLAGVVLELRHGASGDPIFINQALPGHHSGLPGDPIRTVTDKNGFYKFTGLPAGTYAVVQIQPDGVIDNVDTPGTLGGFAVNPLGLPTGGGIPSPGVQLNIEQFRAQFGDNVIMRIALPSSAKSEENNFSEVLTTEGPPPPPPPPPPPKRPPLIPPPGIPFVPTRIGVPIPPIVPTPNIFGGSSQVIGFTWHLSVVNAGWPRSITPGEARFMLTSTKMDVVSWNQPLNQSRWMLALYDGEQVVVLREHMFGTAEAVAVTGDFNGDGVSDIGVFIDGHWFLDINGNGNWDENDLWAQLGSQDDSPVTGDWDADGKTDIGIYGPAWPRDPWAISREPGLPDADNFPTRPVGKMKNMPPTVEDATSGARVLKRTATGKSRADLIDHVFHYGAPADVPVTGDWNGDGIRQIGVFRDGQWNLDLDGDGRFTDADAVVSFGQAGDIPVAGDFDGDGIDEIGVYRAGRWMVDSNRNFELDAQDKVFELGGAGDQPVVGDWNDDGTDDPGVFQPGTPTDHVARRAG